MDFGAPRAWTSSTAARWSRQGGAERKHRRNVGQCRAESGGILEGTHVACG